MRNSCCGDSEHVTNQGEKDFFEEFLGAEKRLLDAAAAGDWTRRARVIDLCKLFGSAETPFQELTTPDWTSVWAGDGVHLTSPAYRVAARLLTAELERAEQGETGEPVTKRQRPESVVPAPEPPPTRQATKPPPPMPKPVAPLLWQSGQLHRKTTETEGTAGTMAVGEEAEAREDVAAAAVVAAVVAAEAGMKSTKEPSKKKSEIASESE